MIHKKAWRSRSGLSYFGEALNNEAKSMGYGIKPVYNALSGITFGILPRWEYGYNPNDRYLSSGMIKTRSALRSVGETALGFAVPAGALGASSKVMRSVPMLNKMRLGYNKWLVNPMVSKGVYGHTIQPALKFSARLARNIGNEYRAFNGLKLGDPRRPFFKTLWRKLAPMGHRAKDEGTTALVKAVKPMDNITAVSGAVSPKKRRWGRYVMPGFMAFGYALEPMSNYKRNNDISAIDTGNFSPEQLERLHADPQVVDMFVQWGHANNRPWYEHPRLQQAGTTRDELIKALD